MEGLELFAKGRVTNNCAREDRRFRAGQKKTVRAVAKLEVSPFRFPCSRKLTADHAQAAINCLYLFTKGFNHVISTAQTHVQRGHYQPKGMWPSSFYSYWILIAFSTTAAVGFSTHTLRGHACNLGSEVADLLVKT